MAKKKSRNNKPLKANGGSMISWSAVEKKHVLKAISIFNNNPDKHSPAVNTFLLHKGKRYPAKHIRKQSYFIATNMRVLNSEFSGGKETERFFKNLGFDVLYTPRLARKPQKPKKVSGVVAQKTALQKILQKYYGVMEVEKAFAWMKTPDSSCLPNEYSKISKALHRYRKQAGFMSSGRSLQCDMVFEKHKLIVEYDERQHFSKARLITLENYSNSISLSYSKQQWIDECKRIDAKDTSPPDRDEKRAYYDAVRDIEADKNGYVLVRIKHGDVDWEAKDAGTHVKRLIQSELDKRSTHVIGRIAIKGNSNRNPTNSRLAQMLESIGHKLCKNKTHLNFLVTVGGFIEFLWPDEMNYKVVVDNVTKGEMRKLQDSATIAINTLFNNMSPNAIRQLFSSVDYITIGADSKNSKNEQHVELVALYSTARKKVIHWTGKSHPVAWQNNLLIRVVDLESHFVQLKGKEVCILGCHDLTLFSPRAKASAKGWKKKNITSFGKLMLSKKPSVILQHPHTTDSANIWNRCWCTVNDKYSFVTDYAGGVKYWNGGDLERSPLGKVLEKTKHGDVVDFKF